MGRAEPTPHPIDNTICYQPLAYRVHTPASASTPRLRPASTRASVPATARTHPATTSPHRSLQSHWPPGHPRRSPSAPISRKERASRSFRRRFPAPFPPRNPYLPRHQQRPPRQSRTNGEMSGPPPDGRDRGWAARAGGGRRAVGCAGGRWPAGGAAQGLGGGTAASDSELRGSPGREGLLGLPAR